MERSLGDPTTLTHFQGAGPLGGAAMWPATARAMAVRRATARRTLGRIAAALLLALSVGASLPDAVHAAPKSRFTPARKFQRGFTNLTLGVLAIPGQMTLQTRERGWAAGLPIGFVYGIGWFVGSEVIGAYEFITAVFPFPPGYKPILEPEFPWQYFEERTARRRHRSDRDR